MSKQLTRGAKFTYQQISMITSTLSSMMHGGILIFFITLIVGAFFAPTSLFYDGMKYAESLGKVYMSESLQIQNANSTTKKVRYNGEIVSPKKLLHHFEQNNLIQKQKNTLLLICYSGLALVCLYFMVMWCIFKDKGKKLFEHKYLRGSKLIAEQDLKKLVTDKNEASPFTFAGVPTVKNSELQSTIVFGAPGSGKSVCIRERLYQIRKLKQKAIVYDRSGTYASQFYRPGKDIILNPLDKRGVPWAIWAECQTASDLESLAATIIPPNHNSNEPFFTNAARIIFSEMAGKMMRDGDVSSQKLLKNITTSELENLREYLKGTLAECMVHEDIAKQTVSIKTELVTHTKFLRYLYDSSNPFSIRNWVEQDNEDSWLFITSTARQHGALKPFLSCCLESAAISICSLSPELDRRIHLIVDEAPSLQNIPALELFASEGRKYGGCLLISAQSPAQLYKIYGADGAKTLIDCCSTQVVFRIPGGESAKWASSMLGEQEAEHANENCTLGPQTSRASISLNHYDRVNSVVLPSEISGLKDLEAFLKIKGDYPLTRVKFKYRAFPECEPGLVPLSSLDEIENALIHDYQTLISCDDDLENILELPVN